MQSKLLGVFVLLNVLLIAAGVGWLITRQPTPEYSVPTGPTRSASDADLISRFDEFDRRLANIERRLGAAESIATEARDLAAALRDARGTGPAAPANAAPAAGPSRDSAAPGSGDAPPAPAKTDEEIRQDRFKQIQDFHRVQARSWVPVALAEMASTDVKVQEKRRTDARLEARQMAVALALTQEQADQLGKIWIEQADRAARDVGPLVKDGLAKADLDAVRTKLDEGWTEMDRQVKEAFGEATFTKLSEVTNVARVRIRDALTDLKSTQK
jgi:hypothetical protein